MGNASGLRTKKSNLKSVNQNRILVGSGLTAAVVAVLSLGQSAQAASATWSATATNGNWEATTGETNWGTGAATFPGATGTLTNTDTATFSTTASTFTSIAVNATSSNALGLNIKSITFGQGGAVAAAAYTIGTVSGNSLLLSSGGAISIVNNSGSNVETVNAPIVLEPASGTTAGTYAFTNNSGTGSNNLVIGGTITGGTTTQGITLTLSGGSGPSGNAVNGIISDGAAAGGLSIVKSGNSTWTLSGANTYTGGTTVNSGGTLTISGTVANQLLGLGTGAVTLSGGTLKLTDSASTGGTGSIITGNGTTGNNVVLSSSSTINMHSGQVSQGYKFNNLTMGASTLTSQADNVGSGVNFVGTTTLTGATGTTATFFADTASILIGNVTDGGNNVSIAKTGTVNALTLFMSGTNTWGATSGTLTVAGTGAGGVNISGSNTYAGGTLLNSGTLTINNANAIGTGALSIAGGSLLNSTTGITLATNNAININGDFTFTGGNTLDLGTGAVTLNGAAGQRTITTTASTLTLGGIISNGTSSGVIKAGTGTLALTGANMYTGATTLGTAGSTTNAGTLTVSGAAGSIATSSGYTVSGSGSQLNLDYSAGATTDRLNNAAGAAVTLNNGGDLRFTNGTNSSTTSESFGTLTLGTAYGFVSLNQGGTSGAVHTSTSAGFARGSNFATALIRGTSLGAQNNSNRVELKLSSTTGLTQVGTATSSSGIDTGSTTNLTIVPYLTGNTSASATGGSNFVTYDSTSGFRVLGASEQLTISSALAADTNAKINNATVTLTAGAKVFNSLAGNVGGVSTGSTVTGAGGASDSLTLTSGALANFGGANANSDFTISGFSKIIFGGTGANGVTANEAIITMANSSAGMETFIRSGIDTASAGGGLTKAGVGTVYLEAANFYTGVTTINQGNLQIGSVSAARSTGTLAAGSGTVTINAGATLILDQSTTTDFANAVVNAGTFNITNNGTQTLSGNISGAGNGTFDDVLAAKTLILSGTNSYSDATTVANTGTLQFNGGAAMSSSSTLTMASGATVSLKADADTAFTPSGSVTLDNGTFNFQVNSLNSPSGNGHTLTLNGQASGTAAGTTTINVSSTTGDTLKFGTSAAYTIDAQSGSAFGGIQTNFAMNGANIILNGLNSTGTGDGFIAVSGGTSDTLTINGNVTTVSNVRTLGATVNSGVLTLNAAFNGATGGANWGFWATLNGGTLNVNNGTIITNNDFAAHPGNNGFVIAGGTLNNTSGSAVTMVSNGANMGIGINGNFAFSTADSTSANDLNLGNNNVTLGTPAGTTRTITTNGSATLTIGGIISNGTTANSLIKAGTGTLALTNANTYTGGTAVNGGTLSTGSAGKLGTGDVTVSNSGSVLELDNRASIADTASLTLSSGTKVYLNFSNASGTEQVASLTFGTQTFNTPIVFSFGNLHGVDSSYFQFQTGTNEGSLTVIPEPSVALSLIGLGASSLLSRRRRKQ